MSGEGKGSIAITARNFRMTDNSQMFSGILQGKGAPGTRGSDITIGATDSVLLRRDGAIDNSVYQGIGDAGSIVVQTGTLLVEDGFTLSSYHTGQGNGGNILINARNGIILSGIGSTGFPSSAKTAANAGQGNGGNIEITTGSLILKDEASLSTFSARSGNSGKIVINARDSVELDGKPAQNVTSAETSASRSSISSSLVYTGVGKAGDIQITTGTLTVKNGALLDSATYGQGNGGNILIDAQNTVTFDGATKTPAGLLLQSEASSGVRKGIGNGGDIRINTGILNLSHGGTIGSSSVSIGNGGNIVINARGRVVIDGTTKETASSRGLEAPNSSSIVTTVNGLLNAATSGNAGDIRINTQTLSITNGAFIKSGTNAPGNAGKIMINAPNQIFIDGSNQFGNTSNINSVVDGGIFPDGTVFKGQGLGGDITLITGTLMISSGAFVSAGTLGDGDAGNIEVQARNLFLLNGGELRSTTFSQANAGKITVNASDRVLLRGTDSSQTPASLLAATGSSGAGGTIRINTPRLEIEDQATISTISAENGRAGNIEVNAPFLRLDNGAISARSSATDGGNVSINSPNLLILRGGSLISAAAGTAEAGGNGGNIGIRSFHRCQRS